MSKKPKAERTRQILDAAMEIAITEGYEKLRRDDVAERAGVATGQINHVFSTMQQLRRAVLRKTVDILNTKLSEEERAKYLSILAQGLSEGEQAAKNAPIEMKQEALAILI